MLDQDKAPEVHQKSFDWNWVSLGLVVAVFAVLAWERRWICDDGLIVLRTVQNILDGNGPVFNAGERVEVNTSTLWTYILAFAGLFGIKLEWASIGLGLLFATGGVFLGLDGARRLHPAKFVVPAGGLVLLALSPFWDFATSGLETGLVTFWLAGVWWLLVRQLTRVTQPGSPWATLVVIGLGPLVRPEFALVSAILFIALLAVRKPGWKRALRWAVVTGFLPVAYQIFRMGYYGLLTPNTALAKEASQARWNSGWIYLADFLDPYLLLIPLILLVAVGLLVLRRSPVATTIVVLAPVLAGLAIAVYVTRVGGDYMHARMLLPSLLLVLLPVLAVPLTRWTVVPVLVIAVWAVMSGGWFRAPSAFTHKIGANSITDHRVFWVDSTHNAHPILAEDAANLTGYLPPLNAQLKTATGNVVAVVVERQWVLYPAAAGTVIATPGALGFPGMLLPYDYKVVDDLALANPLAAHTLSIPGLPMGHDKNLKAGWTIADAGKGTATELSAAGGEVVWSGEIAAAQVALQRPEVREMLDSVRAPLTAGRFWQNLIHSVGRSGLRYDRDPLIAQFGN